MIVIDTNVIYAAVRSRLGASFVLLDSISKEKVSFAISAALVFEYEDTLKRNLDKLPFSSDEIDDFLDSLIALADHYSSHFLWRPFLRDANDDMVLELAVASGSKHIVTFNIKDFEGCSKFNVKAIDPQNYLRKEKLL